MELTLKAARVNTCLTQEEVAKKLGVSRYTIGSWERGKTFPNAIQIQALERLYGFECGQIIFLQKIRLKRKSKEVQR